MSLGPGWDYNRKATEDNVSEVDPGSEEVHALVVNERLSLLFTAFTARSHPVVFLPGCSCFH